MTAFEKEIIVEALHEAQGDLFAASKKLGMERSALDARLKALGLVAPAAAPPPPAKAPDPPPPPPPVGPTEWKSVQV
jgi:hypothetical protein